MRAPLSTCSRRVRLTCVLALQEGVPGLGPGPWLAKRTDAWPAALCKHAWTAAPVQRWLLQRRLPRPRAAALPAAPHLRVSDQRHTHLPHAHVLAACSARGVQLSEAGNFEGSPAKRRV